MDKPSLPSYPKCQAITKYRPLMLVLFCFLTFSWLVWRTPGTGTAGGSKAPFSSHSTFTPVGGVNRSTLWENHSRTSNKNHNPPPSREQILTISRQIDQLVQAKLDRQNQQPNPPASDSIFLRRIYLDVIGRIPTLDETTRFLESSSPDNRADLVDELQDSYGYVSRQFNFWADLLRIKSRLPGGLTGAPYINFVKDSLSENKPYDQFVFEMLTATGGNLQPGNGAVGYYLRDRNMPEDNMSNTIRIFLGTRLECAQCHDHPYDDWTQRQYFEMVAFTGGVNYRNNYPQFNQAGKILRRSDLPSKLRPALQRISQAVTHGVSGTGTGLARLPEDFLGDDGQANEIVVAREMFDGRAITEASIPAQPKKKKSNKNNARRKNRRIRGSQEIGSREIYGRWLTSPDNPRFATVIANRLWKQALGVGLIEPVDTLEAGVAASNPPLMQFLAATMVELDFDMKQFLRAIYLTETYQARAYGSDIQEPLEYCFSGPVVRRLTAEQIWDSLLTLTLPDIDTRNDTDLRVPGINGDATEFYQRMLDLPPEKIADQALTLAQTLTEQGSGNKNKVEQQQAAKMRAQRKRLQKKINQARRKKDLKTAQKLINQQTQLVTRFRQKYAGSRFARASELPSPVKPSHFLREFGQSDRETIDNSNRSPSVPQVLSMMNGLIERSVCRDRNSVLMRAAINSPSASAGVETVFLSMLNRPPTEEELTLWQPDFEAAIRLKRDNKVFELLSDLVWTIANSNEFIFQK